MARGSKQISLEGTAPMVIKKEEKESNGNGIIPVKFDTVDVFYDTHEKVYFAVVRLEGKKLRFEMVK